MSITATFRNLSVRTKVVVAFACTLVATVALGAFAVSRLAEIDAHAQLVRDDYLPSIQLLGKLDYVTSRERVRVAAYMLYASDAEREKDKEMINSYHAEAVQLIKDYQPMIDPGPEQQLVARWMADFQQNAVMQDKMFEIFRAGGQAPASAYFNGPLREVSRKLGADLDADIAYNVQHGETEANAGKTSYSNSLMWISASIAIAAALCFAAGTALIYTVSRRWER